MSSYYAHPYPNPQYSDAPADDDGFSLTDLDSGASMPKETRKRPATEEDVGNRMKREPQNFDYGYQDPGWQGYTNQGMIPAYYWQPTQYYPRPGPSHTPPMAEEDEKRVFTQSTPTEPVVQGSLMYTPETPGDGQMPPPPAHFRQIPQQLQTQHEIKPNPLALRNLFEKPGKINFGGINRVLTDNDYPTFNCEKLADGHLVIDEIDGRLPAVGSRSKYQLNVNELRRRVGEPENMNMSALYSFCRKSKRSSVINNMKNTLTEHNIVIHKMQRHRKFTLFSSLTEEEALQLASDQDRLMRKHFPVAELGQQMLQNLLEKGHSVEKCAVMLNKTLIIADCIVKTLSSRQPAVTGAEERLKGNAVDLPYHRFSLLTHGYGHATSIGHYQVFTQVITHAKLLSEAMLLGEMPPPIEVLGHDEPPFRIMGPAEQPNVENYNLFLKMMKNEGGGGGADGF